MMGNIKLLLLYLTTCIIILLTSTTAKAERLPRGVAKIVTQTSPSNKKKQVKYCATTEPSSGRKLPPASAYSRPLVFYENMICGAISRSIAQTIMHPANTMKTILQSRVSATTAAQFNLQEGQRLSFRNIARFKNFKLLTRGAGAQFIMSVPHGAVNFAVLEAVRHKMNLIFEGKGVFGPGLDFLSSCVATFCCSIVSTPQMMVTDNIMAGTYPNFLSAVNGLASERGIAGFYTGWSAGLAGKIPSYALTWAFFQQLKRIQPIIMGRDPKNIENSIMGCMASAATVCIMIPMDTIKTRLVTQLNYPDLVPYKGIVDCGKRVLAEEGLGAFYKGLAPRLVSVVPMIGIQFGVYEYMKKVILAKNASLKIEGEMECFDSLTEALMEVAADDEQPFPAPRFFKRDYTDAKNDSNDKKKKKKSTSAK